MEKIASLTSKKAPGELGVTLRDGGADVAVFSHFGDSVWLCEFDERDQSGKISRETVRWKLPGRDGDIHYGFVPGLDAGRQYGLRADGPYDPDRGHRFDPNKLLADPYARSITRPFTWTPELSAPRNAGIDTAAFVPRSVAGSAHAAAAAPKMRNTRPSCIYEISVRTFTRTHKDVPQELRGTLAGLANPRMIEHLVRLGVSHVELMPVTAWIDERHLSAPGLTNVWGYNPVLYMALDPRLAPGGMGELRAAVDALHDAGISVLLDVVFNHTGESDVHGATVSLRGLDNAVYYRHSDAVPAQLINDTGCGNTLACERAPVVRLVLDSLRRFAVEGGIDGFRFDLAPTVARVSDGFSPDAPVLAAIAQDPLLRDLIMIAEPWDVGPGGYQLGNFPRHWLEWNDRFRDDVRRFWRGDQQAAGAIATRIAGSPDVFDRPGRGPYSSVNFIAAHDGFTVQDCVSYEQRHNLANGEDNRDGHGENYSWNCGHEGPVDNPDILAERKRDIRALLATLFLSRGTPMLTAGDEFGRTQSGNNNAYAQDNAITWLDWDHADIELAGFTARLIELRQTFLAGSFDHFLTGKAAQGNCDPAIPDVSWWQADGAPLEGGLWDAADQFTMVLALDADAPATRLAIVFNRARDPLLMHLPEAPHEASWMQVLDSAEGQVGGGQRVADSKSNVAARSVAAFAEFKTK